MRRYPWVGMSYLPYQTPPNAPLWLDQVSTQTLHQRTRPSSLLNPIALHPTTPSPSLPPIQPGFLFPPIPTPHRPTTPILSSLPSAVLTILALSPGNGLSSSFGSITPSLAAAEEEVVAVLVGLFSLLRAAVRKSSKAATSSDVRVMAVGLRRSIVVVLGWALAEGGLWDVERIKGDISATVKDWP